MYITEIAVSQLLRDSLDGGLLKAVTGVWLYAECFLNKELFKKTTYWTILNQCKSSFKYILISRTTVVRLQTGQLLSSHINPVA